MALSKKEIIKLNGFISKLSKFSSNQSQGKKWIQSSLKGSIITQIKGFDVKVEHDLRG